MTISEFQKKLTEKGWALLPLRLMIGFGFATHGYDKLSRGPGNFAAILSNTGVPHPHIMAWLTCVLEFVGGISVMAGAFVAPFSIPFGGCHADSHVQRPFSIWVFVDQAQGSNRRRCAVWTHRVRNEFALYRWLLTLAIGGSGKLSIDQFLKMRSDAQRAGNLLSSGATEANTERGADPTEVEERG